MANILEDILENKKKEVETSKEKNLLEEITASWNRNEKVPSFAAAIYDPNYLAVIGEIKRKSPSHGVLDEEANYQDIALSYEDAEVNAISILTDKKFFGGSFYFMRDISKKIKTPLLCKDFIIDRYQIDLAYASGASAVLLITDILGDNELRDLYEYAHSLKLDALVEGHKPENIKRASQLGANIIGINNRNLFTLEEDLEHSVRYRDLIKDEAIKLSLSSFKTREDAIKISHYNYDTILIGSVIMKSFNKKAALKSFMGVEKRAKLTENEKSGSLWE